MTSTGRRPSVERGEIERLRDLMSHRGPDGAGYWSRDNAVLAHRRLAVIDPTPGGHQPFVAADGTAALVYNGELYNDAELRRELVALGVHFETASDTETVLKALLTWGVQAVDRFRGMYALGFVDLALQRLFLARDPLGIKPIYWTRLPGADGVGVAFASEMPPLVTLLPRRNPDLVVVSAYLTTIRTTLGERTLFDGIYTLAPGQRLEFDLSSSGLHGSGWDWWERQSRGLRTTASEAVAAVRAAVEDSVCRHLRSDVPTCCLLSGGLDSAIIATLAKRSLGELWTYCSGARDASPNNDFGFAGDVSRTIGSHHTEAPVTRDLFAQRWPEMVDAMGMPLSTPNEVAINEVARRLRADGKVVTLSGEGADELFGGYTVPMSNAAAYCRGGGTEGGRFQLDDAAWTPVAAKSAILSERVWKSVEHDASLIEHYRCRFEQEAAEDRGLRAHLRFMRGVNLAGLLQRLDTATMLAGVEGRTPLADVAVALLAESLPIESLFREGSNESEPETKIVLRSAFSNDLPPAVIQRPKASFPLPFQEWIGDQRGVLSGSAFARELFTDAAVATVEAEQGRLWQFAWPMMNIALWGRRWWG